MQGSDIFKVALQDERELGKRQTDQVKNQIRPIQMQTLMFVKIILAILVKEEFYFWGWNNTALVTLRWRHISPFLTNKTVPTYRESIENGYKWWAATTTNYGRQYTEKQIPWTCFDKNNYNTDFVKWNNHPELLNLTRRTENRHV